MTREEKGGRLQYTRATSACTQRSIDRTHVRFDENLHATSCGLSPSLLIKSSVTILSRYPRGVEAAPIMVAMMMMMMMTMIMMMVVVAKGERRQIIYGVNVYTLRIEYADFSIFSSSRGLRASCNSSSWNSFISWNLVI